MEQTEEISIYVAAHKKPSLSLPSGYRYIQVNAKKNGEWQGFLHDDEGDQISEKNASYSELTALYSLWKNDHSRIKGLVHYRRFFTNCSELSLRTVRETAMDPADLKKRILTKEKILEVFAGDTDAILALPLSVFPLTVYEDLCTNCEQEDIAALMDLIRAEYPAYYPDLLSVLTSSSCCYYNMLIARASVFDAYCAWLFEILGRVEERTDVSGYDRQRKRLYGYLAEILLNVYVKHQRLRVQHFQVVQVVEGNLVYHLGKIKTALVCSPLTPSYFKRRYCMMLAAARGLPACAWKGSVEKSLQAAFSAFHYEIHSGDKTASLSLLISLLPYQNAGRRIWLYSFISETAINKAQIPTLVEEIRAFMNKEMNEAGKDIYVYRLCAPGIEAGILDGVSIVPADQAKTDLR